MNKIFLTAVSTIAIVACNNTQQQDAQAGAQIPSYPAIIVDEQNNYEIGRASCRERV